MTRIVTFVAVALLTSLAACGGNGKSCTDLCTSAQAGSCTAIRGSCASFCGALDAVQGPAGCTGQRNEYQTCLSVGTNVCANSCTTEETALANCVQTFCLAHGSDPNCVTLATSF
jgi:hypothetical protein